MADDLVVLEVVGVGEGQPQRWSRPSRIGAGEPDAQQAAQVAHDLLHGEVVLRQRGAVDDQRLVGVGAVEAVAAGQPHVAHAAAALQARHDPGRQALQLAAVCSR
ncbi:MAG: hypothetical protein IPH09_15590 [bacterium]|nr:hypothetical protein [bacterium]